MSVFILNYLIDPYCSKTQANHNNLKCNIDHPISHKLKKVKRGGYSTFLMGSSRVGVMNTGLLQNYIDAPAYNLAIPGSLTDAQLDIFKYALKFNPIKTVILGIDFSMTESRSSLEARSHQLTEYSLNQNKIRNFESFFSLSEFFSSATLKSSIKVISYFLLNKIQKAIYLDDGTRIYVQKELQLKNGNPISFEYKGQIEQKVIQKFQSNNNFCSPEMIDNIEKIVSICKNKDITLYVYIPPIYFEHYLTKVLYQEEAFLKFKRELANITDYVDFTGINLISMNKEYFYDSSHLNPDMTTSIFDRILGHNKQIKIEN